MPTFNYNYWVRSVTIIWVSYELYLFFKVYLQIQELFIINQNILSDIQIRMIDQKDYIL